MIGKVYVRWYATKFLSHTYVSFVNSIWLAFDCDGSWIFPFVFLRRVPEHAIIQKGTFILHLIITPSRIPIHSITIGSFNIDLIFLFMLNPRCPIRISWNSQCKTSEFIFSSSILFPVPSVEVTKNCNAFCSRSPLFVMNISVWLYVQTIPFVRSTNIDETTLSILKYFKPLSEFSLTQL